MQSAMSDTAPLRPVPFVPGDSVVQKAADVDALAPFLQEVGTPMEDGPKPEAAEMTDPRFAGLPGMPPLILSDLPPVPETIGDRVGAIVDGRGQTGHPSLPTPDPPLPVEGARYSPRPDEVSDQPPVSMPDERPRDLQRPARPPAPDDAKATSPRPDLPRRDVPALAGVLDVAMSQTGTGDALPLTAPARPHGASGSPTPATASSEGRPETPHPSVQETALRQHWRVFAGGDAPLPHGAMRQSDDAASHRQALLQTVPKLPTDASPRGAEMPPAQIAVVVLPPEPQPMRGPGAGEALTWLATRPPDPRGSISFAAPESPNGTLAHPLAGAAQNPASGLAAQTPRPQGLPSGLAIFASSQRSPQGALDALSDSAPPGSEEPAAPLPAPPPEMRGIAALEHPNGPPNPAQAAQMPTTQWLQSGLGLPTFAPHALQQLRIPAPDLVPPGAATAPKGLVQQAGAALATLAPAQPGRIELLLAPESLGRLHFDMRPEGGALSITLSAERPETMDLMRRHLPELMVELKQLGLQAGSLSFGSWNEGRHPPAAASPQPHAPETVPPADTSPPPAPRKTTTLVSQGLDLRL